MTTEGSGTVRSPAGDGRSAPFRVAAVLDTWIVSGPGRQLAAVARALRDAGVHMRIFMFQRAGRPPSPFIDYMTRMGVDFRVIEDAGALDAKALSKLDRAIEEFAPHVVQTHGYRPTGMIAALRLRRRRPWRWVGFFHGATKADLKDRVYNQVNFFLLPFADQMVVLSKEHREWFPRAQGRIRIIHNACLDLPPADQPVDLAPYRRPGRSLIGVLARLSHEKGVDILIDALARLSGRLDVALVVAGDGPEEAALRAKAKALGLSERVHFLGRVSDVMGLYRQLDVLVVPSRAGAEGLPNVLLEAIIADTPVVATRVAAVPEVLTDPNAGLVVEPADPQALSEAIAEALRAGRSDAARAARKAVTETFSLAARVKRHMQLYHELGAPESNGAVSGASSVVADAR